MIQPLHDPAEMTYEKAISNFFTGNHTLFFVQIGGFDGISFDPLRPFIEKQENMTGLIAEPVPDNFAKLQDLYRDSKRIQVCNYAIDQDSTTKPIWRFMPTSIEQKILPAIFSGISSFTMETLLQSKDGVWQQFNDQQRATLKRLVEPVMVHCRTIEKVFLEFAIAKIDLLHINTEGHDYIILNSFDFERFVPEIVYYQHIYMDQAEKATIENKLTSLRYTLYHNKQSTLAIRGAPPVLRVAYFLMRDQRIDDAITLYQYYLSLKPNDVDALIWYATALSLQGLFEELLGVIIKINALSPDMVGMDPSIKQLIIDHAPLIFNKYIQMGDMVQAGHALEALLIMVPGNETILNKALIFFSHQDRSEQTINVAISLLNINPTDASSYHIIKKISKQNSYIQHNIDKYLALAKNPPPDTHAIIQMQTIYLAVSALLLDNLNGSRMALIDELRAITSRIASNHPISQSDDTYCCYSYYRTIVETLNLHVVVQPMPPQPPWPQIEFASSSGQPIEPQAIKTIAAQQQAEVVFFVAADPVYIARYAKRYVSSLIKHCDVPFLMIIHVIGGINRLQTLVAGVGLTDDRLIYCADSFNPETIQWLTSRSDGDRLTHELSLVVYYQSARFLWLEYMLEQCSLPLLVTDIDQLLQRGIKDMMDHYLDHDIVFHEHFGSQKMSSRLTANLLLVKPTKAGILFARFIRYYLKLAFQDAHNRGIGTYFKDQEALLMAQHHVLQFTTPKIGSFGQFDINHHMYKTYEKTPFRFFSMYSGFDDETIPDAAE